MGKVNRRHDDVARRFHGRLKWGPPRAVPGPRSAPPDRGAKGIDRQDRRGRHGAARVRPRARDLTGYEYQTPIFVVTHRPPETPPKGQNEKLKVRFVPEGVESAIRQATSAAKGKDVTIIGGAQTIRQALAAQLVDELEVGIVPVFLGSGLRMFERMDELKIQAELHRVLKSPGRVDLLYRISK